MADSKLTPSQRFQEIYQHWRYEVGDEAIEYVHENMMAGRYRPAELERHMANFAGFFKTAEAAMGELVRNGCTLEDDVRVLETDGGSYAVWLPRPPKPHKNDDKNQPAQQPASKDAGYVQAGGAQRAPANKEHNMSSKTDKNTKTTKTEKTVGDKIREAKVEGPVHNKPKAKAKDAAKPNRDVIPRTGFDGTYTLANGFMPDNVIDAVLAQVLHGHKSASALRRVARKYVGVFADGAEATKAIMMSGTGLKAKDCLFVDVDGKVALFKPLSPKALKGIEPKEAGVVAKKAKAKQAPAKAKDAKETAKA